MKFPALTTLALLCGCAAGSRAQEGKTFLLPLVKELSAPALPPGANKWPGVSGMPTLLFGSQWRDVGAFAALIPGWPDLNRPCKAQAASILDVVKNSLRFQPRDDGGFTITAGPEKERVFQFRPFSREDRTDEEGSCRAHLYYYCVAVYQKADRSYVRVLLPLKDHDPLICLPDVEIEGPEDKPPNRADLIRPLHGIVLPESIRVTTAGDELLSTSALRSLSLRCRIIPHTAFRYTLSGSTIATHPWHTVELAGWNREQPSTWSGSGESTVPRGSSFALGPDAAISIHAHCVNQWANGWSSRWRHALTTLPKPKLAKVPAGIEEKGGDLIREDASIVLQISVNAMTPSVLSSPRILASASAEEPAPGVLGNLQWTVNSAQFQDPPGPAYEWSLDPAIFCVRAVKLLDTAPADVRRAVLFKLGLEDAGGGTLKSIVPPPVFTTFKASDLKVELREKKVSRSGFLLHSGTHNRPEETDTITGRITAFAACDVLLKYNLVTTWTGEKGAKHKVTMDLQGPTRDQPVVVRLHRDPQ